MLSRFSSVLADHWAVIAFYVAVAAAAGLSAFSPRFDKNRAPEAGGAKQFAGWTLVLILPPFLYLAALAAKFSVEASLFTAILGATVLMWMFSLVDEFVPVLFAVIATLFIGLAPARVALGGFSSPSLLLLIGVFALSAVISISALSSRVMLWVLLRLPDRPFWHQFTLLPVGTHVRHVGEGGAISFSPTPDDYGEKAMELAIDWLDERTTPGAPPPVESSSFEVAIKQSRLAERGVVLPPIYTEAARENGTLLP